MDEEYKPIITDEERATRRAQRAEARRKKQREKRRRLLRRLVPCGLLAVLCVGLVTVGAQLIEKPAPEMVKAERPFQVTSVASAPAPEPYARAVSGPDTIQLGEDFPSRCAVLVDLDTRTVLAEKNADTVISPASMTKVLTVLVAAEHITEAELDDTFTMTYDIIAPLIDAEASRAGFEEGETVPLKDLMYGIALPSGADTTTAISIYLCGSEDEFVKLMNEKAEELGLENTHFTNASGLYDPNHYSTATDIAMLMSAVMENDTCREILGTYQYTTSATEQHPEGIPLESTMFSRMYGNEVTGITIEAGKTGYTDEAGHCLVSYATDADGKQFIAVTAKGPTYWRAVFDTFAIYGLVHDGYPMPDNLAAEETDENGSAIDTTETSAAPAA